MTFEPFIGKWIAARLFGYGFDVVKASFQQPRMIEAFEKACIGVVKEENHLFKQYSAQALGSPVGISNEESLWFKLEQSFAASNFPDIQRLTEMLVECWKSRKKQLNPSEASDFFSLSEELVQPIIQKISTRFFRELSQIPEFADPFIIQELQKIHGLLQDHAANTPPPQILISFEDLKGATLKASASLFIWPTTLGDNQWLERREADTLLERIEANDNSTTILLGPPGSGKSALLSVLGHKLKDKGLPVLAIKADKLPSTIDSLEKLSSYLNLPIAADACLSRLAMGHKAILIVDQLDALSELVDRKSERLNVLLSLIQTVSSSKNVHVVSSSRWFEFRHDTRLNTVQAEHLELEPLSWEQVRMVMARFGISDQNWSDEAQAMLNVPLHLKIFLDLRIRNASADISVSLQGLLEALWQQRVLNRDGASGRNTFVHELAQRMSEHEELWVPRAIADVHPEAFEDLERQEILTLDENGLRIGFRHQTYFDFARARYFAQGRERLSEYVLERQDGLFIRPILLSSLEYLRGADSARYRRELLALWNHPELRSHLRSLLIEFLAALPSPNDVEINCLLPIHKKDVPRALIAMAGSQGWFMVIKEAVLAELMSKPPDRAALCVSVLTQALQFDRRTVIDSVRRHWLPDSQYDALTLDVLQYLKMWDEEAADMVCLVARRTAIWGIPYITEVVSQLNPQLAPRIVRADLDRRLLESERKDAEQSLKSPPPADASLDDLAIHSILDDPRKNIKELFEGDLGWHELSAIAESAPEAFLDRVWPWFVSVLDRITGEPHPFVVGYRDDHCLGTILDRAHGISSQPTFALRDAIVLLSESVPKAFLGFFRNNETSSLLTVHRLLCKGLEKLARNYPKVILEYLTADPRRLTVGDFEDCHKESRTLISSVAPFLDRTDLDVLEKAVLEWNKYYGSKESWTPEDRHNRLKWNREHRLRLLRAFPDNSLSEKTKRFRNQEERAFPGLSDWDSRFGGGGWVGSPMAADQMQKAKDSDILKLFEEVVDSTEWDHPRYQKYNRFVGGAIQASRELGSFAEREPARAASLLVHFKPNRQELAAGAILQGLAKSDFPSDELFRFIMSLDAAGFSGNHFRTDVARALELRAERDKGLPAAVLHLMESWLPLHPEPALDRVQQKEDNRPDGSLLWGLSGAFSLPGGRDLIFDAIAKGYLLREPQEVQGWARVLARALEYEQHPDVWKVILGRMPSLFNGDRDVATELYDQVLTRFPQARESALSLLAVASIIPSVSDIEIVHKWLDFYRKGEWPPGHQAFGEMLIWHLCHKPADTWGQNEVRNALKNPQLIDVHRGIAFAAAYNWSYLGCQELCTSALVGLAGSNDRGVHQAMSLIFRGDEALHLNSNMRSIIEAIIPNDNLLMASAINLIEGLVSVTSSEPELVFNICNCVLGAGIGDIKNTATISQVAEPLVSVALTLHRMPPPHRERGLLLFEKLSESNIREARQALDTLDRRPLRSRSSRLPPRRRKHRRRT